MGVPLSMLGGVVGGRALPFKGRGAGRAHVQARVAAVPRGLLAPAVPVPLNEPLVNLSDFLFTFFVRFSF